MENEIVRGYIQQGLNRLSKEKLVFISSNLMNMRTELAMKVSENIPGFFEMCDDVLYKIDHAYRDNVEKHDRDAQIMINALNDRRKRYEKCFSEAKTEEEKGKYDSKI